MPVGAIVGGAVGAIGGMFGSKTKQSQESWIDAGSATGAENAGQQGMMGAYGTLQDYVNRGPGGQDVSNAYGAQTDLASMLKQMSETGGMPGAGDISQAQGIAGQLFAGQRVGMQNAFGDQLTQANRDAALSGRGANDPILRAKLAQEQMRQSSQLDANQGSYGSQLAMSLPGQRLGFAGQRANVLGGLATQAMANRQAIAAMGEGIMQNERQFRLQTAKRYGTQTQESGGGIGGALKGAIAGAGAGFGMSGGMGGSGGTGFSMPQTGGFEQAQQFFGGANPYAAGGSGFGNVGGGAANQYSLSGNANYGGGRKIGFGY